MASHLRNSVIELFDSNISTSCLQLRVCLRNQKVLEVYWKLIS